MTRAHDTLLALAGFVLWALCFVALYGAMSVACAMPRQGLGAIPGGAITMGLGATLTLFVAAHAGAITLSLRRMRGVRERQRAARPAGEREREPRPENFLPRIGLYLNVAALGATLAIGLPVLILPPCQ